MVLHGHLIWRADIPKYRTEEAMTAIQLWSNYKCFGLPFAGGWAEQPAVVMDVLEVLENEWRKREAEARGKINAGKR